jgi:hypothetical protein
MSAIAWTVFGNPFIYRMYAETTLEFLGELPFIANPTFGRSLNQPGPFQASLNISDPQVQATGWREVSLEATTLVVPELYGVPLGAWAIAGSQYQKSSRGVMPFQGQDAGAAYFQNRNQAYDYTSTWNTPNSGDPMSIMAQVLQDAINMMNADGQPCMGLEPSSVVLNPRSGSPSGATVSVSYPSSSQQQVDSMMSTLSQMGYTVGPDYSFDWVYRAGTKDLVLTCNIWSPRRGRTVAESGLMVQHQQLIDSYYPVNGLGMATNITETGSGTGSAAPVTITTNLPGYPRYDKAMVHTQVNTDSVLEGIAFGDASRLTWPVVTPWIKIPIVMPDNDGTLDPSVPPQPGTYDIGDDIEWVVDPVATGPSGEPRWGLNNDPRFPDGFDFDFRIEDWTITNADKGVSYAQLDLGIPPTNIIPPPQPPA